ncbi:FG-GAP-like repeat-containing protein [Paraflavitalea pollutisoli]|uniref:FG-GAP-like repeat-containing protein n=1 Tax=Paraflavitalea pollutisoli TaxID=3034143 RepID=UPI0023EBD5DA|nr:FG-GAP-like repeat-containing protein [Paraflavitalea sp. H1-2-19X]
MDTVTTVSAFGIKQGSFSVDANGAANYQLPIQVPPGIAQAQPNLKLVYNHSAGNGECGIGWRLSGLSAITRIAAIPAIDGFWGSINYQDTDRFALDGQRLINIIGDYGAAGTTYYTENNQWKQVVAGATPQDGFTVYTKSGAVWSYGTTPDSCIMALGSGNVREWALASIQDLNGNRIEYQYTNTPVAGSSDMGACYLSKILYTVTNNNAANFSIQFAYSPRPDVITTFLGGYPVQTGFVLTGIQTMMGSDPVLTYTLTYGQGTATGFSRIETITLTDADGNTLPAIEIGWQDVAQPGFDTSQPATQLLNQAGLLQTSPVDVNGDGITDILQFYLADKALNVVTFLASQSGGQITYSSPDPDGLQLGYYDGTINTDYYIYPADVNGDGLTDIMIVYPGGGNNQYLCIDVFINDGSSFSSNASTTVTNNPWLGSDLLQCFAIDANGDGRVDLVQAYNDAGVLNFNVWLSDFVGSNGSYSATAFNTNTAGAYPNPAFWPMDVNNDGIIDMVVLSENTEGAYQVTSFITTSTTGGLNLLAGQANTNLGGANGTVTILPVDVNGDGVLDILQLIQSQSDNSFQLQPYFSTGTGSFVAGTESSFDPQGFNASNLYPLGLNGNGQTNIVAAWLDPNSFLNFTIYAADPSGVFTEGASIPTNLNIPTISFFAGDVNGDGKGDLLYNFTGSGSYSNIQPFPSIGPYPDLASSISDALGNTTTIEYAPLTDASVYTETAPAYPLTTPRQYPFILSPVQYPVQGVLGMATYVVSAYTLTNNTALNKFPYEQSFTQQYRNAAIDLTGRGWLGFQTVQHTNTGTGLTVVRNYLQSFPFTGALASVLKIQQGNQLLRSTVSTYQANTVAGAGSLSSNAAVAVLKTGVLDYYYYIEAGVTNFESLTARSFAYDSYGNQTEKTWWGYIDYIDPVGIDNTVAFPVVTPQSPEYVVYRYRQYQNDVLANGWALGYLLYEKQSANSSDADITSFLPGDYNLSACTYTPQTYNLLTRGAWDDQNNVLLTTSFTYDSYGNRKTETRPGNCTTQYTFDATYNCYQASMTSPANAQGTQLVTQYGYDPRFGKLVAQQNGNDVVSIVAYDGFGRKITEQGPIPPGCTQTDTNQCTPYVTGTVAFGSAAVLTLSTIVYQNDGEGGIYLQGSVLQQFPNNNSPVWADHWKYVDGKGRTAVVAVQAGGNNGYSVQVTSYGAYERPHTKTLPFFSATVSPTPPVQVPMIVYTYDALERPLSRQTPAGANNDELVLTTWAYTKWGQTTITEAYGAPEAYVQVVSRQLYNGKQQQVQSVIVNDNNATTLFSYDALGRQLTVTDPQGLKNTLTYDSLGRKIGYDNADQNPRRVASGALSYQYSPVTGAVQTITNAMPAAVTYTYDALGRVLTQVYTDGRQIAYTYDTATNGLGQLATVSTTTNGNGSSQKSFGYDVYGNATTETLTVNDQSYTTSTVFDPLKRMVGQTYDDGMLLTRTYDCGLLVSQQLEAVEILYPIDSYSANSRYGEVQYFSYGAAALTANYTYNSAGTLYTETFANRQEEPLLNFSYTYDQLHELLTSDEAVAGDSQAYTYTAKKIQTVSGSAGMPTGSYTFDTGGRITANGGYTYNYQGSNCPQTMTMGTTQYTTQQDGCGRIGGLTVNGATNYFVYAASGDLISIIDGGTPLRTMQYDESGNRIFELFTDGSSMVYVNPVYRVYTDVAGNTTILKNMVDSGGLVATLTSENETAFYRRDQKQNITHIYNEYGVLLSAYAYDGLGNPTALTSANKPAPLYEGRDLDRGTGLYYFGARYYNPTLGLFLAPDSRLGARNKLRAGAWNRFAFELNNPVNQRDPSGHLSIWADIGIAAGAVAMVAVAAVGIALTVVTAGASDAAAAELEVDLGSLEVAEVGGAAVDAGADAAADASVDAATDVVADAGGEAAAGSTESGGGLGKTLVRVGVRLGTNAIKGAVVGAVTNSVEYEVESGFKGSWSGLLKAAELGALSGAVSGVVSGELTAMVNLSDYSLFGRMAIQGVAGAIGNVSGKIVASEILNHQFPSATSLAETAGAGFVSGALVDKDNLVGLKNAISSAYASWTGPVEIEMTVFREYIQ